MVQGYQDQVPPELWLIKTTTSLCKVKADNKDGTYLCLKWPSGDETTVLAAHLYHPIKVLVPQFTIGRPFNPRTTWRKNSSLRVRYKSLDGRKWSLYHRLDDDSLIFTMCGLLILREQTTEFVTEDNCQYLMSLKCCNCSRVWKSIKKKNNLPS